MKIESTMLNVNLLPEGKIKHESEIDIMLKSTHNEISELFWSLNKLYIVGIWEIRCVVNHREDGDYSPFFFCNRTSRTYNEVQKSHNWYFIPAQRF